MTNLKQLDKNVDTFEEIVNNLANFSEVSKTLKEAKDTMVTGIQEFKTLSDEVGKNTSSIEKKYDKFTEGIMLVMGENKNDINKKFLENESLISAAIITQGAEIQRGVTESFNNKNFVLIMLIIISLIFNIITLVYLFMNLKK